MMDITPFRELKIAPRAVFDRLPERAARPRFMLPDAAAPGGWRPLSWGAFAEQIRHAACFLHGELGAGDRAAIYAPNSVAWIASALAIQAAGGVMVPIYPASTAEQAAYVAHHADARVVFVDSAPLLARIFEAWPEYASTSKIVVLNDQIDPARVLLELKVRSGTLPEPADVERRVISFSRALELGAARDRERPEFFERVMHGVSLDQPALMLYTSGTSGPPKGVPLTHRNVAVNGLDWLECNGPIVDEGMIDLLWLPMSHIFGLGEACLGNTLGWTTYLTDPTNVMHELPEVRPEVFMSVPSVWEKLATAALAEPTPAARRAALDASTGGRLRFCLSGGAGLKREVKELFHECGVLIIEGYGLTECSPTLTLNRPDAFRFDTVGKPLPSIELKLAEDGEILARGPSVFGGYHKDPESTRAAFTEDGWFKTGDVGRMTDDGFLQIIDRKKDILVTAGGKNVPPANIELRFRDDPFLTHVVVYGDAKRFLVAGVWLNQPAVDDYLAKHNIVNGDRAAAVRALVAERIDRQNRELASYETIKKFVIIDTPLTIGDGLTPTLKVQRKKVYERFRDRFEELYA
jgi:long-chain acyl-CoA synthetase